MAGKSGHGSILQSEALKKYIFETSVYPREHEQLKELTQASFDKYKIVSLMGVPPDEAQFLSMLLKIMNAKKTMEIGVFTGYSLLATALALPEDGKIIAIDPDREAYEVGLPYIQKAGVEHKIEFIQSEALPVLQKLLSNGEEEGTFDFIFIDADKENYLKYHEIVLKLVKVGGVIGYDNTLWFGTVALSDDDLIPEGLRELRRSVLKINSFLATDPRIELAHLSIAAATSLLCISHNLRKYRIRKLLFVDRYHGQLTQFSDLYLRKIRVFYCLVVSWMTICFLLKIAREVTRAVYLYDGSIWWSIGIVVASLVSWAYSTIIFLVGTALFHLVGNLQVIHFENFGELLEMDLDVSVYINEHMRLTFYLCKISHRFRIFLILEFLIVTASQCVALLQTTRNQGIINFINAGDFAVLSIVQLVGLVICLNAAAKISHRAQGLGSVASRWHALVTCNSNDASVSEVSSDCRNVETPKNLGLLSVSNSEADLESADYMPPPTNIQLTSNMSSYHKRQAFVAYVQSNTGGFSIFGWMVDRLLINSLFFIEMTLVTFLLGMTLTIKVR